MNPPWSPARLKAQSLSWAICSSGTREKHEPALRGHGEIINPVYKRMIFFYMCFKLLFIYFERESMSRGGVEREREGERESQAGSTMAVSAELDSGLELTNCEIVT